jgi:lipopolysaccharide transport system ATP-binding protein
MSEFAIRASGLGKMYHIGGQRQAYGTLRDSLTRAVMRPIERIRNPGAATHASDELWALKDLELEVQHGQILGVIGRNGAGKSTLLKVLSRITEPTTGRVEIAGRVGSLLEVGTGFHPELTGRENIFLNGAILGMRKREIERKFDEIVAFAETERFLDTPVKRYSSGMYVRLAFSVAAHLEPDILLVDEVLAVGDAAFQKKCLGKVGEVASGGRTVLLVSHNMGIVREVAESAVWLSEGTIKYRGTASEAVRTYLASGMETESSVVDLSVHRNRLPGMRRVLKSVGTYDVEGVPVRDFAQDETIVLKLSYVSGDGPGIVGCGFNLRSVDGVRVGGFNTYMWASPPYTACARGQTEFFLPASQLTPGAYYVTPSVGSHPNRLEDMVEAATSFTVLPSDIYGTGYLLTPEDGVLALRMTDVRVGDPG